MQLIALDTETEPFDSHVHRVRDRVTVPPLVCTQVCDGSGVRFVSSDEVRGLLKDPESLWVGHNVSFDFAVLEAALGDVTPSLKQIVTERRVLDTMVLVHLREPTVSDKSLAGAVQKHLHRTLEKSDVQVSFRRGQELTDAQKTYALEDARVTRELAEVLRDHPLGAFCENQDVPRHTLPCPVNHRMPAGLLGFHTLDHLFSACLVGTRLWMEPVGWELDQDSLVAEQDKLRQEMAQYGMELKKHGVAELVRNTTAPRTRTPDVRPRQKWTLNPRNGMWERRAKGILEVQPSRLKINQHVVRSRLTALEVPDVPVTPTGHISMEYKFWKKFSHRMPEEMQIWLKFMRCQKIDSTYFKNWRASRTGRVYPRYWIPGTETLRWSSSRPNIQNIPKALRRLFRLRNLVVIGADYTALESYTLAHHMACLGIVGPLMHTLASGEDIHSYAASLFMGGTPESHPRGSRSRQVAKAATFGIPGGMGAQKLHLYGVNAFGLDWTIDEAQLARRSYLKAYVDVAEYINRMRDFRLAALKPDGLSPQEWVESLGFSEWPSQRELSDALDGGRHYDVHLSTGMCVPARNYSQALNSPFQHLGAVAITEAMLRALNSGLQVVAAVHDALYVACAPEEVPETKIRLSTAMRHALIMVCPLAPEQTPEAEEKETFF